MFYSPNCPCTSTSNAYIPALPVGKWWVACDAPYNVSRHCDRSRENARLFPRQRRSVSSDPGAGSKSWIFRYSLGGKRREMGWSDPAISPPRPSASLEPRNLAAGKRALDAKGAAPNRSSQRSTAHQRLEEARSITWDRRSNNSWRPTRHVAEFEASPAVAQHADGLCSPLLKGSAVASIGTPEVTKVLDPIWKEKPATASRVRGRIERVLDWAKVRGYRDGENPARWRGHLDKVSPRSRRSGALSTTQQSQ